MKILKFSTLILAAATVSPRALTCVEEEREAGMTISTVSSSIFDLEETKEKIIAVKSPTNAYNRLAQQLEIGKEKAITIPSNLCEMYSALKQISYAITTDSSPDIIDIIFLLDANGKTQCVFITKFLSKLEDALEKRFAMKYPGIDFTLSFPVDAFVGSGSGAIPAALAALGKKLSPSRIDDIISMPSKLSIPKCCHFFRCGMKVAKDFVSAYLGKSPTAIDEDDPDWSKLIVDSFDIRKRNGAGFEKLFGSYSKSDLQSNLEVISLLTSPCILDMVNSAIAARHLDTKKKLARVVIADTLEAASSILEPFSDSGNSKISQRISSANSAINSLKKINLVSLNNNPNLGSISELKSILTARSKIKRNLVIVSLTADTAREIPGLPSGGSITTSFSNCVKYSKNDLKIVDFNYKFAIPSYMYEKDYGSAIDLAIAGLFPKEKTTRKESSSVVATTMLLDFLETCNEKVLSIMKDNSADKMLLESKDQELAIA
ncbi:MAG: hypothetical protein LBU35_01670 [Holosporales bacterium]|jgi:hypothetical protein|nr:hypothetical protein [Holosporales bacterium]